MGAFAIPILPGKLEGWNKWMTELNGPKKEEFQKFNARHGITSHRAWLQTGPDGSSTVIVVLEGPGADKMMAEAATSVDPFDVSFREHVTAAHGMDFKAPPPPPADLRLDIGN
jgi:hypothetical protein